MCFKNSDIPPLPLTAAPLPTPLPWRMARPPPLPLAERLPVLEPLPLTGPLPLSEPLPLSAPLPVPLVVPLLEGAAAMSSSEELSSLVLPETETSDLGFRAC